MPRDLTPHQQRIVKRYYENKDTLMCQKLAEIVSELYVCTSEKKASTLWERARKALVNADANARTIEKVCEKRDVKWLADIVAELF